MPSAPYNADSPAEAAGTQRFKIIENLKYIAENPGGGGGGAGSATSDNQTNGAQKTQIVDGSGNVSTVSTATGDGVIDSVNRLRVSASPHAYNGSTWDRIRSGIIGAISSRLGYQNVIPVGTYNTTVPTLTNGQSLEPQISVSGRTLVEPLGLPAVSRQLAAGSASANTALTTTCRRISMRARSADIRYVLGTTSQTANASTSHFIGQDERLDIDVPDTTPNIAIIRAAATDGTLEVTELT